MSDSRVAQIYTDVVRKYEQKHDGDYTSFSLLEKNLLKWYRGSLNRGPTDQMLRREATAYLRLNEFKNFIQDLLDTIEEDLYNENVAEYFPVQKMKVVVKDSHVVSEPIKKAADLRKAEAQEAKTKNQ